METQQKPREPLNNPRNVSSTASLNDFQIAGFRDTAWWAHYFRKNRQREWQIPWTENPELSEDERARIAPSIIEFQRGESSEARNFLAKSRAFADAADEPSFHEASVLFVAEENLHAALLLGFMDLARIPPERDFFSDGIFRQIRSASDIGWSCRVLIIAELAAQEYYPLLREVSTHPVLRRVCDKLIFDEFAHIRFQIERIARAELHRGWFVRRIREVAQTTITFAAALVVYRGHHTVLRPLGCFRFVSRMLRRNQRVIHAARQLHARAHAQNVIEPLNFARATRMASPTSVSKSPAQPAH